jgi:FtsP/CotA-like multicopper oxidase with cupredoxin domain
MSCKIKRIICGLVLLAIVAIVVSNWASLRREWKELTYRPQTRTYYIAVENVTWDYAPTGKSQPDGGKLPLPWGAQTKYPKVRYIGYTDDTFTTQTPQPTWLGILGPIIRGVPGDTIKVILYNKSDKPYSIHPHGVKYDKANEGAAMDMASGGTGMAMMDMPMSDIGQGSEVHPGEKYTYTWTVRDDAGPTEAEGGSKVWLYHSHVNSVQDVYDGLVGPIIITSRRHSRADATPDDADQEFVTLFMIFDESKPDMSDDEHEASQKHAINGYIFGNLPGLTMKKGERVRWYVLGLGNEDDLHTPHWHGNVVKERGFATDVLELLPGSMHTVDMVPDNPGAWMFHCHVADHIRAGMVATYTVTE